MKIKSIIKHKFKETGGSFYAVSQEAIRNFPSELRGDFVKETGGSFYEVSQEAIRNFPSELRGDFVKETGGSFTCQ